MVRFRTRIWRVILLMLIGAILSVLVATFFYLRFEIPFLLSTVIVFIISILVELIVLNIARLEALPRTLVGHFKQTEERILVVLKMAFGSVELSNEVREHIIRPLSAQVIGQVDLDDEIIMNALCEPMKDFKETIELLHAKGLKIPLYSKYLYELTERWAHEIRAISLLIPTVWLSDPVEMNYLQLQVNLLEQAKLSYIRRIFIYDEKYEDHSAWQEIKRLHKSKKGNIEIGKIIMCNADINSRIKLGDFVIFKKNSDIRVLYSPTILNLMIRNDIADTKEYQQNWESTKPFIQGMLAFSGVLLLRFIYLFDELSIETQWEHN